MQENSQIPFEKPQEEESVQADFEQFVSTNSQKFSVVALILVRREF
jgi:hypothetical protein